MRQFRLAPMSPVIRWITVALFALPPVLFASAVLGQRLLALPALFVTAVFVWVWLRFRPTRFIVHPDALEVAWPLKRRQIVRGDISLVRIMDREELRREIVQMYISAIDRFVWIEVRNGRPWLITPEDPEEFVRVLSR